MKMVVPHLQRFRFRRPGVEPKFCISNKSPGAAAVAAGL